MKKLVASLILISLISGATALAQIEEEEIRILIARAPVARVMAEAEDMEGLAVWNWLMALAYTGHNKEAFAAAAKIRKWMNEGKANSAIAFGLAITGKVDEALSLLRRTKDPSVQSLIVEILAKGRRFSEALSESRKLGADGRNDMLQRIARELTVSGEVRQALEIVGEIKDQKSLNDALQGVTEELLKAGKISEAKAIAEKFEPTPTKFSPLRTAISEVISDIVRDGSHENAQAIIALIENEVERSWPLSILAESFIATGRLDKALETARKIKHESLLPITLASVAEGFSKKGENDTALNLLKEAISLARQIKDIAIQENAISSLIPKLAGSGLTEEALALADNLNNKSASERAGGIDSIAKSMAEAGKTSEALKLLRSYGRKIPFPHDSVVAIVEKLAQAGKMNEVFAIRNDFLSPAAIDGVIVEGLLKAGRIDDALAVAQNIKDKDDRSEAFSEVSEFLLRSGSYKQARHVADLCPSHLQRMFLYFEIFNELSFRRDPQLREQVKNYRLINPP